MDGHVHRILVWGLYFVGICTVAMFGSIVWNMAMPTSRRFLDAAQVATLQSFLFSGLMGSAVSAAARKVAGTVSEPTTGKE